MPTFMFFKGGQKVHEFKGANQQNLLSALQLYSGSTPKPLPAQAPIPEPTPAMPQYPRICAIIMMTKYDTHISH
jgi:hypothetical protein